MELQSVVEKCFTADLLFRSPHNAAATLFIDGGVRATGEQPLGAGRIRVPTDVSQVLMDRLAAGHHLCGSPWERFQARRASTMAIFQPAFVVPDSFSPVELEEDPGDTRGHLFNNGAERRQRSKGDNFGSSGPPGASASIIYSEHFACKAASVFRGRQETQETLGILKLTPERHRARG